MMLKRTAKSCGSDAPMLASSLREEAQATVSNKPGHRGDHEVSRKTIARGCRVISGEPVVTMLGCLFLSAPRLRVHRAPGIPCALYSRRRETIFAHLGQIMPRDRGVISQRAVIARSKATRQSTSRSAWYRSPIAAVTLVPKWGQSP
jgi:hypothetical protein